MKKAGGCYEILELLFLVAGIFGRSELHPFVFKFFDEFLISVGHDEKCSFFGDLFFLLGKTGFKRAQEVTLCGEGVPALLADVGREAVAGNHARQLFQAGIGFLAASLGNVAFADGCSKHLLGLFTGFFAKVEHGL